MNITLSPDVEKRIEKLVERGSFPSVDAVVEEALDSFLDVENEEDLHAVRKRLAASDAEIDRGEFEEYDAENVRDLAKAVEARGREKLTGLAPDEPRR